MRNTSIGGIRLQMLNELTHRVSVARENRNRTGQWGIIAHQKVRNKIYIYIFGRGN